MTIIGLMTHTEQLAALKALNTKLALASVRETADIDLLVLRTEIRTSLGADESVHSHNARVWLDSILSEMRRGSVDEDYLDHCETQLSRTLGMVKHYAAACG